MLRPESRNTYGREHIMIGYARAAEFIATIFFSFLILGFYVAHIVQSTGFFTSRFGGPFTSLFFISILFPIITVTTKMVTKSKLARAFVEWVGAVLFVTVAWWFYTAFPLNFVHVADVLPSELRFIFLPLANNEIGRLIVGLVLLAGAIAVIVDSVKLVWRTTMGAVRTVSRI